MTTKVEAIKSLAPNAEFVVVDGNVARWDSPGIEQPTDAEIDTEIVRLDAEYASQQYARNRAAAYPSIGEQLDMQYWDGVNGTTTWADAIAAVKAAHPKPA